MHVDYALQDTIRRLAREQGPQLLAADDEDAIPEDVRRQIYGQAVEWVTGFLLHEIASPTLNWGDTDVDYWISVLDHGNGIVGPAETAFEIGNSTKQNHIGFGLAIARQAVETMIGSLALEPAKDGGALYTARWRK